MQGGRRRLPERRREDRRGEHRRQDRVLGRAVEEALLLRAGEAAEEQLVPLPPREHVALAERLHDRVPRAGEALPVDARPLERPRVALQRTRLLGGGDARVLRHRVGRRLAHRRGAQVRREREQRVALRLGHAEQLGVEERDGVVEVEDDLRGRGA